MDEDLKVVKVMNESEISEGGTKILNYFKKCCEGTNNQLELARVGIRLGDIDDDALECFIRQKNENDIKEVKRKPETNAKELATKLKEDRTNDDRTINNDVFKQMMQASIAWEDSIESKYTNKENTKEEGRDNRG